MSSIMTYVLFGLSIVFIITSISGIKEEWNKVTYHININAEEINHNESYSYYEVQFSLTSKGHGYLNDLVVRIIARAPEHGPNKYWDSKDVNIGTLKGGSCYPVTVVFKIPVGELTYFKATLAGSNINNTVVKTGNFIAE